MCGNTGTREQLPVPVVHESAQCRHASRSRIPKALTRCRTQIVADAIQRMFGPISTTLQRKCAPQASQSHFPSKRRILKNSLRVGFRRPANRFERSASEMPSVPATCLWLPCWVRQKVRSSSISSLISDSCMLDHAAVYP